MPPSPVWISFLSPLVNPPNPPLLKDLPGFAWVNLYLVSKLWLLLGRRKNIAGPYDKRQNSHNN